MSLVPFRNIKVSRLAAMNEQKSGRIKLEVKVGNWSQRAL